MSPEVQNAVTLLIVAVAASYILRGVLRLARSLRAGASSGDAIGCGSCGSCSAGRNERGTAVTIELGRDLGRSN